MKTKLILGDCLKKMQKIPDEFIDLVVTDPPYPTISGGKSSGLSKRHTGGMLKKNDGKIFKHNDIEFSQWLPEIYRVLKDNTHCYIMTNLLNLFLLRNEALKTGFQLHNLLVWEKQNCTPNRWYMKNCEYTPVSYTHLTLPTILLV